jgi:hypothetical protein
MYVSALRATGYRNLEGTVELCHPLAVLVGENNAGKSNVIDGLRTVLELRHDPVPPGLAPGRFMAEMTSRVIDATPLNFHVEARRRLARARAASD